MQRYRIVFTRAARRSLTSLPEHILPRVDARILALSSNPRPHGVKKLKGPEGHYALRVGDYRVIYDIQDDRLVVIVIRIRHRRESYR
ncbi:MAG: type II toxin-antitoxin system RelE/ParE family toxin [bacterium]